LRPNGRALDPTQRLHVAAVLLVGKLQLVSIDAVGVIGSDAGVNCGLMHALAEHVVDRTVRPIDGQLSEIRPSEAGDLRVEI
jgi:hypothetical protein